MPTGCTDACGGMLRQMSPHPDMPEQTISHPDIHHLSIGVHIEITTQFVLYTKGVGIFTSDIGQIVVLGFGGNKYTLLPECFVNKVKLELRISDANVNFDQFVLLGKKWRKLSG